MAGRLPLRSFPAAPPFPLQPTQPELVRLRPRFPAGPRYLARLTRAGASPNTSR